MPAMKKLPVSALVLALTTSFAGAAFAQTPATGEPAATPPPPQTVTTPVPTSSESERTASNSIFIELLGNGLLYSINYDRMLMENLSVRVGLMYLSLSAADGTESAKVSFMLVPVMLNYLLGSGSHKLEIGAGPVVAHASGTASGTGGDLAASGTGVAGTAVVGYRYVPKDGGFTFRGGFTPLFSKGGFFPWVGLSFGYVF
jgi:hypothetical protein